jgi:hypothetical protein
MHVVCFVIGILLLIAHAGASSPVRTVDGAYSGGLAIAGGRSFVASAISHRWNRTEKE